LAKLFAELGDRALPISLDANNLHVVHARERGWRTAFVRDETIVLSEGRHELLVVPTGVPNLARLAAIATAWGLGLAPESLRWDTEPSKTHRATPARIDATHSPHRALESYSPRLINLQETTT
jgi:hypothetical protein